MISALKLVTSLLQSEQESCRERLAERLATFISVDSARANWHSSQKYMNIALLGFNKGVYQQTRKSLNTLCLEEHPTPKLFVNTSKIPRKWRPFLDGGGLCSVAPGPFPGDQRRGVDMEVHQKFTDVTRKIGVQKAGQRLLVRVKWRGGFKEEQVQAFHRRSALRGSLLSIWVG